MKAIMIGGAAALLCAGAAGASPGLGEEVYGAGASAGRTELEARYQRLDGGLAEGRDMLKLEATHHVNDRLRLAVFGEFARDPGAPRRAEELGFEAIYGLGRVGGIDVALYGEYAVGFAGEPDGIEAKLIAEHHRGPFDARINLTVEKPLAASERAEASYAAMMDYAVGGEIRLGVEAFGSLGTFRHFAPHAEHFVGPRASVEIEGLGPELELTVSCLAALDRAHEQTRNQLRIALEMEF